MRMAGPHKTAKACARGQHGVSPQSKAAQRAVKAVIQTLCVLVAVAAKARGPLTVPGAGLGRRKQAIARVRLVPGTGAIKVNGRELADYFPNKLHQQLITDPFTILELSGSYDVVARITGGGDNNRPSLKKAGFLKRDPRVIERKKAGLKKARKASQFSKR